MAGAQERSQDAALSVQSPTRAGREEASLRPVAAVRYLWSVVSGIRGYEGEQKTSVPQGRPGARLSFPPILTPGPGRPNALRRRKLHICRGVADDSPGQSLMTSSNMSGDKVELHSIPALQEARPRGQQRGDRRFHAGRSPGPCPCSPHTSPCTSPRWRAHPERGELCPAQEVQPSDKARSGALSRTRRWLPGRPRHHQGQRQE